jgi:hypothetical protein
VALLKIDGKTVRKTAQADVGGLAGRIAFSPDGRNRYVGNFVDGDVDILRLEGDTLTKVASFALPGTSGLDARQYALKRASNQHRLERRFIEVLGVTARQPDRGQCATHPAKRPSVQPRHTAPTAPGCAQKRWRPSRAKRYPLQLPSLLRTSAARHRRARDRAHPVGK